MSDPKKTADPEESANTETFGEQARLARANEHTAEQTPAEGATVLHLPPQQPKRRVDYALDCARRGFLVFPLVPGTKRPMISQYAKFATIHEPLIRQWWSQWPNANVGYSTDDLCLIDIDPRNGGDATFQTLDVKLPDTAGVNTAGGGKHLTVALIDAKAKDNSKRALFSKYRRELITANLIACDETFAWVI